MGIYCNTLILLLDQDALALEHSTGFSFSFVSGKPK
jgi:hypothetical protein